MGLGFPHVPRVEWYLNGWQDITTDVRQKPGVQITQARRDWSSKTPPCGCRFTLDDGPDHGDGDYNPENPMGQWFEELDRNVPLRVSLLLASDTFTRTVSNGWGTATTGETWTNAGGAGGSVVNGDWNVAGGVGTMSVPVAAGYRYSVLNMTPVRNVTVAATTTVALGDITGGDIEPGNVLCRRSGGTYYMARVVITSAETVTITIHHSVSGQLAAPVTVPGLVSIASPKVLRVKLQAEDETLRAKVYAPGAEPVGWHVEVHDNQIATAGTVGIRNGVGSGNSNAKPIVFSVDDVTVESPRFAGEVVKMVPKTSTDHADQWTEVEAAGIRRRLSKGERAFQTAIYRYATRAGLPFTVSDYWPLDYPPEFSAPGTNVINGQNGMRMVRTTGGALKWGTETGVLAVERAVTIVPPGTGTSGQMFAFITSGKHTAAAGCGAVWMQRLGSDREAGVVLDVSGGVATSQLYLHFLPNTGTVTLQWLPSLTTVMTVPLPDLGDDTKWHVIGFGAKQSGGNVVFDLAIDDDEYQVTLAGTIGVPTFIQFAAFPATIEGYEVTNAVIINQSIFAISGGFWNFTLLRDKYLGLVGETAEDRFDRLCREEGISPAVAGVAGFTPTMGPQRPLPFMKLIDECVDVAMGTASDPRGTTGLALRTPNSVITAPVALTLNYAAGTISPDFGPVRDDQGLLNDVTAKRPNGGEYRYEQTSGPGNTNDPGTAPGAVGRADTDVDVNVQYDTQLPDQAGWRVHMGTIPGPRYPTVTLDLAADAFLADPVLTAAVLDLGVDDAITITNAQARRIYDDVRLIARGWTEAYGDQWAQHKFVFNTTPAEAYDGATLDDGSRLDSDTSTVAADFTVGSTSLSVATAGGTLWTTAPAEYPFHIKAGGVVLNATACTGTSSPQTMTVDATPVNGVVKTIRAGTQLSLADPVYLIP